MPPHPDGLIFPALGALWTAACVWICIMSWKEDLFLSAVFVVLSLCGVPFTIWMLVAVYHTP